MTPQAAPARVGSLLIVDDSSVQRAHAVALCRELGVKIIYEAASGLEALELLSLLVLPPDLLIVDLEMPGMDGVELIQQLQQRQFGMPLIVASSREYSLIQSVEIMARNLGLQGGRPAEAVARRPARRSARPVRSVGHEPARRTGRRCGFGDLRRRSGRRDRGRRDRRALPAEGRHAHRHRARRRRPWHAGSAARAWASRGPIVSLHSPSAKG